MRDQIDVDEPFVNERLCSHQRFHAPCLGNDLRGVDSERRAGSRFDSTDYRVFVLGNRVGHKARRPAAHRSASTQLAPRGRCG